MATVLTTGQYQLCRSDLSKTFLYGRGASSVQVLSTSIVPGSMATQDQTVVGHDGVLFGVDTLPGAVITQTGYAMTSPSQGALAMDAFDAMAANWNDPAVRLTTGAVQILRMMYPGSAVTRRVYGRGRAIQATMGQVFQGLVPYTAQFQCADNNFYEDVQNSVTLTMATTGSIYPAKLVAPVTAATSTLTAPGKPPTATMNIGGTVPTWLIITVTGPVNNPTLTFLGNNLIIGYTGTVAAGQTLVIDSRPWARTTTLNGASAAGGLSSSPLINMSLWPGLTTVQYEGNIVGSTPSTCTIAWYNAVQAIGGSF